MPAIPQMRGKMLNFIIALPWLSTRRTPLFHGSTNPYW